MATKNFPESFNVLIIVLLQQVVTSLCKSESEILLDFKESLIGNNDALRLSWNTSTSPCSGNKGNWVGVLCEEGNIWGLKLENMGLSGVVDLESLKELRALRTISLTNNNFDAGLPDLKKLSALKSVYLSNNKFSGEIEGNAFDGMQSLKKIYLANNQFTGMIPLSMTILPKLIELNLEGNKFEGEIPDFPQSKLRSLNLSNNALEGQIPTSLSKMNASSFLGNEDLCGPPLQACASDSKLPVIIIVVVVIVVMAAALAAIAAVFIILRSRHQTSNQTMEAPTSHIVHKKKAASSANLDNIEEGSPDHSTHSTSNKKAENSGKLSFLRDDRETFDLADLLKASAEVLGSGYFGSSYKAALMTGKVMVVKRFKHVNNVGREEFQEHMRRLGKLRHPNLLPLVAFYYRKEEKLLVSDYVDNVSLAVHLHGCGRNGVAVTMVLVVAVAL